MSILPACPYVGSAECEPGAASTAAAGVNKQAANKGSFQAPAIMRADLAKSLNSVEQQQACTMHSHNQTNPKSTGDERRDTPLVHRCFAQTPP